MGPVPGANDLQNGYSLYSELLVAFVVLIGQFSSARL